MIPRPAFAAAVALLAACASSNTPPPQPVVPSGPYEPPLPPLTPLNVELRMMGGDTTWLARGPGYELVARSRADMPALNTALAEQAKIFHAIFDADPSNVVVTIRRVTTDPRFSFSAAPVPPTSSPVIEAVVGITSQEITETDNSAYGRGGRGGGGERGGRGEGYGTGRREGGAGREGVPARPSTLGTTQRVLRAWMAARATSLTGRTAESRQLAGEVADPRIPAWAEEALFNFGADSQVVNRLAVQLAAQVDSLYPLDRFFTMSRPAPSVTPRPGQGEMAGGRGDRGGGGGGYGRGGGGRRGGMGGMGRGSMSGGRAMQGPALHGATLFTVQSTVLSHYLASREGARFVGAIIDAEIQEKPVLGVLGTAKMVPGDFAGLETQWRHWLDYQAKYTRH